MKVLFISSGNTDSGINPVVYNQGESLKKIGLEIDYFPVIGRGWKGYFKNIPKLKNRLKQENYDLCHAHYSLSGYAASLAGAKPLIVSLMGSDIFETGFQQTLIKGFKFLFWDACLVKSNGMKHQLGINSVQVIPNGVDLEKFRIIERGKALIKTGFSGDYFNILFLADPSRREKNYDLALKAVELLPAELCKLHTIYNLDNNLVPYYLNAADCLLLTSYWEGSPNVIKEAMACNCSFVATDVGDVREIAGGCKGCHITSGWEPAEVAAKLEFVRNKAGKSKGRTRIKELGLDADKIGEKLKSIYEKMIRISKH